MRFGYAWRPYQARVLESIEGHLNDRKLHIVAAPGAGKTSLGLEVFRLLGRACLVLAPTRTIRDQWLVRLADFLPRGADVPPDWASTDLGDPSFLTAVTYQALHTRTRSHAQDDDTDESEELERSPSKVELGDVVSKLKAAGVGTLILDEAHHLRQEWWKALSKLVDALPGVTLVSLTATPPYDAAGREWRRYEELCGPVDDEISIPELVRAGTLCPHQDYVFAVTPTSEDVTTVRRYDAAVERLCDELLQDTDFVAGVLNHPWVSAPDPDPEEVLDAPELAVALLVFLRATGSSQPRGLLRLLGCRPDELPKIDRRWWQALIKEYLYGSTWADVPRVRQHRDELKKRMRREGLLWRHQVRILDSRPVKSTLALSSSKIDGCVQIYQRERGVRGMQLRQVVLTDYVRDDGLGARTGSTVRELGAWPVFEALISATTQEDADRIALLTGRLAVLHSQKIPELQEKIGAVLEGTHIQQVAGQSDYVRVNLAGSRLVRPFTEMLADGVLRVVVGTRALLGEGWDAPCVNSLVLASVVGSFVMTNQMRGRAIRTDPGDPAKTASIWHLVAVDPLSKSGRSDLEDLAERFKVFVGLSSDGSSIEGGLGRLQLPRLRRPTDITPFNDEMCGRLVKLHTLAQVWRSAIEYAEDARVRPTVRTSRPPSFRPFLFMRTLRYVLYSAGTVFAYDFLQGLRQLDSVRDWDELSWAIVTIALFAFAGAFWKFALALRLWVRHLPVDGSVRLIATALRDALCKTGLIKANLDELNVRTEVRTDGAVSAVLVGGSFYEQSVFANCLSEILGPIANPRYLLTRSEKTRFGLRHDFHAVPVILAVNKDRAQTLHETWRGRVGPSSLIYTRTPEGRRILLKARLRSFSSAFATPAERYDRWQ
jgi:superfamily II DNA or RNA helicase